MTIKSDAADLMPLPEVTFHVLVALADGERHGYAILQDVEARTDGAVRLSAGTLYRAIHRMLEQGLVVEPAGGTGPARDHDDERRRYYRITPLGTAAVRAESARLSRLVELARAKGLAPRRG